jgi:hypothetical protein
MATNRLPVEHEAAEDPLAAEMYAIRELLIDVVTKHRAVCSGGGCVFVPQAIAFIAHSVGLNTVGSIATMEEILETYNRECPHCTDLN